MGDSDARFRQVHTYATFHGFTTGFPNFHEADWGNGPVRGTLLLPHGVARMKDLPVAAYGGANFDDVPAMMRAADNWAQGKGYGRAFPNFHASGAGGGVYGTVLVDRSAVEWRDVPRDELGVRDITDVGGMMRGANDWAGRHGFAAGLPTFQQANYGHGVVCGVTLFKPAAIRWRDVSAAFLARYWPGAKPWLVLLCHFSDVAPGDRQRWVDMFTETGTDPSSMSKYWSSVSAGLERLSGAQVTDWIDLGRSSAEFAAAGGGRETLRQWAVAKAGNLPLNDHRVVVAVNSNGDHGASGGSAIFAYAEGRPFEPTFMAHELGHGLGFAHSFGQQVAPCASGDGRPGAYCDRFDIMSAMAVASYSDRRQRVTGPGLAAPTADRSGWLESTRVYRGVPPTSFPPFTIQLVALNHPEVPGYLAMRLARTSATIETPLWVEYRQRGGFDAGLPGSGLVLHRDDGLVRLQTNLNGGFVRPGEEVVVPGPTNIVVRCEAVNTATFSATVTIRSTI